MNYKKIGVFLLVFMFLYSGCATTPPHSLVHDYKDRVPASIAVLPVRNETVDMDAPKVFRQKLFNTIFSKGYASYRIDEIDSKLQKKGVREAGQLGSLSPQEMGKCLGVDALLYTTITEWSTTYLVIYAAVKVGARFQLIDAETGEQLWQSEHEVTEKIFGADENSIGESIAFAALEKYEHHAQRVITTSFSTLPNGPNYIDHNVGGGCLGP